jgi:sigma-E factor negative regulatory protein RseA
MTVKPFDQLFESLSAMVDDEASELEMRRVLKSMDGNPEVLERWRSYHLIGSVMRKEHNFSAASPTSLASSITNTLSHETDTEENTRQPVAKRGGASGTMRDMLGKTAIAASFAATLVMGFHYMGTTEIGAGDDALAITGQNPAKFVAEEPTSVVTHTPIGFELPLPEARTVSMTSNGSASRSGAANRSVSPIYLNDISDHETQEMLNHLLILHAERASAHGSMGIMPFARVHKMGMESAKQ